MMIDPNLYLNLRKDMSYKELLYERDLLIDEIRKFEEEDEPDSNSDECCHPTPAVVYQKNLIYLAKLCEFIRDKYCIENNK